MVSVADPQRRPPAGDPGYRAAVEDWQDRREAALPRMIARELARGGTGGFLVWGDPALYDGTLRILDRIAAARRIAIDVVSVPGISSVQALAAPHRIALNRTGRAFTVTTGRRLADEGMPAGVRRRRGACSTRTRRSPRCPTPTWTSTGAPTWAPRTRCWCTATCSRSRSEIRRLWAEHRARKGWIMDTYLLRRRLPGVTSRVLVLGGTAEARRWPRRCTAVPASR